MKKTSIYIICTLIISFVASLLFEIFVINNEVLGKKSEINPIILESVNMVETNKSYKTGEDSYIVVKSSNNYINKITFDYKTEKSFGWDYTYEDNGNEVRIQCLSSSIMDKAIKKVDKNINKITLHFYDENIKISNIKINNDIFIYWYRVIAATIILSMIVLFFIFRKKIITFKIHNLFLMTIILLGLLYTIVLPKTVYTVFDDQIHYDHVLNPFKSNNINYSVAEQIIVEGSEYRDANFFPTKEEKLEFYKALNRLHKETNDRKIETYNNRDFYGNLVYLPFYVGYKLSNTMNLNFTTCFMVGKLFNLLLYSLLFYIAVRIAKYGKKIVYLIGLIPVCLFYSTQYSYDSTIIAGLVLATVCFINIITSDKINKKEVLLFILATLWASLPKALYCVFLLLLLFIPNKKFNNKKQAYIFKLLLLILTMLVLATFVLPTVNGQMTADERGGDTSVGGQMDYIFSNPIEFSKTIIKFTIESSYSHTLGYKNFAYMPYVVSGNVLYIVYGLYLITLLYYTFKSYLPKIRFGYKFLLILETVGIWLLFCAALYIKFTLVGSKTISGVQPRYMLPLFMAIFYVLMFRKNKEDKNNSYLYIIMPIICSGILLLYLSIKIV